MAVTLPLIESSVAAIVVVPRLRAVASPLAVMLAMPVFDELQVAVSVMSCVVPSENVPVAVNCCKVPSGIDGFVGVTAIEVTVAPVTVNVALAKMLPDAAVMVDDPAATPCASPGAPFTLIVATARLLELHCTEPVTFCVLPSLNVPMAANCCVVFCAIDGAAGVTDIDCRTALVTLTVTPDEMLPEVAVTVVDPSATPSAIPAAPFALMPTIEVLPDDHCTDDVITCELPSLNVPVAASCKVVPTGKEGFAGEIVSVVSAAAVIVTVVLPLTPEAVAVIVAEPNALDVAMPVPEIATAVGFEELQLAELVRSRVLWSL